MVVTCHFGVFDIFAEFVESCRFMTRPDVKQKHLGDFLDWTLTRVSQASDLTMEGTVMLDGALQSLVLLWRNATACGHIHVIMCKHKNIIMSQFHHGEAKK